MTGLRFPPSVILAKLSHTDIQKLPNAKHNVLFLVDIEIFEVCTKGWWDGQWVKCYLGIENWVFFLFNHNLRLYLCKNFWKFSFIVSNKKKENKFKKLCTFTYLHKTINISSLWPLKMAWLESLLARCSLSPGMPDKTRSCLHGTIESLGWLL